MSDNEISDGAIYAAVSDRLMLKERDAMRAEIERLTAERDALKSLLTKCAGDTGAELEKVTAERDALREAARRVVDDYPVAAGTVTVWTGADEAYGSIKALRLVLSTYQQIEGGK